MIKKIKIAKGVLALILAISLVIAFAGFYVHTANSESADNHFTNITGGTVTYIDNMQDDTVIGRTVSVTPTSEGGKVTFEYDRPFSATDMMDGKNDLISLNFNNISTVSGRPFEVLAVTMEDMINPSEQLVFTIGQYYADGSPIDWFALRLGFSDWNIATANDFNGLYSSYGTSDYLIYHTAINNNPYMYTQGAYPLSGYCVLNPLDTITLKYNNTKGSRIATFTPKRSDALDDVYNKNNIDEQGINHGGSVTGDKIPELFTSGYYKLKFQIVGAKSGLSFTLNGDMESKAILDETTPDRFVSINGGNVSYKDSKIGKKLLSRTVSVTPANEGDTVSFELDGVYSATDMMDGENDLISLNFNNISTVSGRPFEVLAVTMEDMINPSEQLVFTIGQYYANGSPQEWLALRLGLSDWNIATINTFNGLYSSYGTSDYLIYHTAINNNQYLGFPLGAYVLNGYCVLNPLDTITLKYNNTAKSRIAEFSPKRSDADEKYSFNDIDEQGINHGGSVTGDKIPELFTSGYYKLKFQIVGAKSGLSFTLNGDMDSNCEKTEITSSTLSVASDFTMNYYVRVREQGVPTMHFEMCDVAVDVEGELFDEQNKQYVYRFKLSAQSFADTITATLVLGDKIIDEYEYSVEEYLNDLSKTDNITSELRTLIADIVEYGQAAEAVNNREDVGIQTIDGCTPSDFVPVETTDFDLIGDAQNGVQFASVTVKYTNVTKLVVKFLGTNDCYVKVNDKVINKVRIADGKFSVETDSIFPTDFEEVYTFELFNGNGELIQTLKYSVESYVYEKQNSENLNTKRLVRALYNYSKSLKAYAEVQ